MKLNPAIIRFGVFTLAITIGFYFLFDQFLKVVSTEIVSAWYNGEIVNIQEGQLLPSISKNRNLVENSPLIKGVFVLDLTDLERPILSLGKRPRLPDVEDLKFSDGKPIHTLRTRFLEQLVFVSIPSNNLILVYYIASDFLLVGYLLCVALGIFTLLYMVNYTKKVSEESHRRKERIYTEIRERLAHDLKSPMLSLRALGLKVQNIDGNLHQQLNSIVSRFQNILNSTNEIQKNLANDAAGVAIDTTTTLSPIYPVLLEAVTEKRTDFSSNPELELELNADVNARDSFVSINPAEFKRHISNLLQNSFEAIQQKGRIEVRLIQVNSKVQIEIIDTGKGISPEHLSSIGTRNFSFGKPNGNGLGFHYAKLAFQLWKGSIELKSELGKGTEAKILLPSEEKPAWFKSSITFPRNSLVVCVDDDETIFTQIKERIGLSQKSPSLIHFSTSKAFSEWYRKEGDTHDNILFLFDYHLDKSVSGLDLISKFGLESESILVTTAYLEAEVTNKALEKKIKIFPKSLIAQV